MLYCHTPSLMYAQRFILTMWYVNKITYTIAVDRNYRFILTMWYVNRSFFILEPVEAMGFILTMWYVNNIVTRVVRFLRRVLY